MNDVNQERERKGKITFASTTLTLIKENTLFPWIWNWSCEDTELTTNLVHLLHSYVMEIVRFQPSLPFPLL